MNLKSLSAQNLTSCVSWNFQRKKKSVLMCIYIYVTNSPRLCRAGRGQRRGYQWCHSTCKWWRCEANLPASPGPSVWSSGTLRTPRSVKAYTHTHKQRLSLVTKTPFHHCIITNMHLGFFFPPIKLLWLVCSPAFKGLHLREIPCACLVLVLQFSCERTSHEHWVLI